jgi:hypothetical protein
MLCLCVCVRAGRRLERLVVGSSRVSIWEGGGGVQSKSMCSVLSVTGHTAKIIFHFQFQCKHWRSALQGPALSSITSIAKPCLITHLHRFLILILAFLRKDLCLYDSDTLPGLCYVLR